jgi:thiamine kinase-like enzyme
MSKNYNKDIFEIATQNECEYLKIKFREFINNISKDEIILKNFKELIEVFFGLFLITGERIEARISRLKYEKKHKKPIKKMKNIATTIDDLEF